MLTHPRTRQASQWGERASSPTLDRSNILASVSLSNYNCAHFLRDTADSALHQTYPSHRARRRRLDRWVGEIIAGYGNWTVPVYKESRGPASSVNAGIPASRGDVVRLLDTDALFLPE
jgi:glycosyltransferase involved in cell wall biosynthesis